MHQTSHHRCAGLTGMADVFAAAAAAAAIASIADSAASGATAAAQRERDRQLSGDGGKPRAGLQ